MPTAPKSAPVQLPSIPWASNDHALVWKLIGLVEEADNRKILIGRGRNENSSGESKNKVYKRLAQALVPHYTESDPQTFKRVKSKWDNLCKHYKGLAQRLIQTGGGLQNDEIGEQVVRYKVPVDGPDGETPYDAKNLWDQIVHEWPFFPRFHSLLATHPNLNPVVITTGVGPHGQEVLNLCGSSSAASATPPPIHDSLIDPSLLDQDHFGPALSSPLPSQFPTTPTQPSTPSSQLESSHKRTSSLSRQLEAAVKKATTTISRVPKKRSIEDSFMFMQGKTLKLAKTRMVDEKKTKKRKLDLQERQLLLQEFQLGLLTREEYRDQLQEMKERSPEPMDAPSSDWDYEKLDKEMGSKNA